MKDMANIAVQADDDDRRPRIRLEEKCSEPQTIDAGEIDIQQDDIRPGCGDQLHGLETMSCLPSYLKARYSLQGKAKAGTNDWMIIFDQDGCHRHTPFPRQSDINRCW